MKVCPFCAEEIQDAAIVCKHCGRDLPAVAAAPPAPAAPPLPPESPAVPAPKKRSIGCLGVLGVLIALAFVAMIVERLTTPPRLTGPGSVAALTRNLPDGPLPLTLLASRAYNRSGYHQVEGEVRNDSREPLRSLLVVVRWYGKDGTFISADDALVEFNPLMPAQTTPFKSMIRSNPLMDRYTVEFKQMFGGAINFTDARKK